MVYAQEEEAALVGRSLPRFMQIMVDWLRDRIESTPSSKFEMTEARIRYCSYSTFSCFSLKNIYFVLRRTSSVKLCILSFGNDYISIAPQICKNNSNLIVKVRVLTQKRSSINQLTKSDCIV